MSINTKTNPPSLDSYDLFNKIDVRDDEAVADIITRVCKVAGVQSAAVRDGHLYVTIKGYDEPGGFKLGRELSKVEFIDEAVSSILAGRSGAQKVQTRVGRGAGGGGYI